MNIEDFIRKNQTDEKLLELIRRIDRQGERVGAMRELVILARELDNFGKADKPFVDLVKHIEKRIQEIQKEQKTEKTIVSASTDQIKN